MKNEWEEKFDAGEWDDDWGNAKLPEIKAFISSTLSSQLTSVLELIESKKIQFKVAKGLNGFDIATGEDCRLPKFMTVEEIKNYNKALDDLATEIKKANK